MREAHRPAWLCPWVYREARRRPEGPATWAGPSRECVPHPGTAFLRFSRHLLELTQTSQKLGYADFSFFYVKPTHSKCTPYCSAVRIRGLRRNVLLPSAQVTCLSCGTRQAWAPPPLQEPQGPEPWGCRFQRSREAHMLDVQQGNGDSSEPQQSRFWLNPASQPSVWKPTGPSVWKPTGPSVWKPTGPAQTVLSSTPALPQGVAPPALPAPF